MSAKDQNRTYSRRSSVVFCKTGEEFGGLSNMAAGFPLRVNEVPIRTSEALYQACRFPHRPELQQLIIDQKSPMVAKMKGKPHRKDSRSDWEEVKVALMRWCLRVKLAQNWESFGRLLRSTGDKDIVEESRKDSYWGALKIDEDRLEGRNVLGRLLMELRQHVLSSAGDTLQWVDPPAIENLLLLEIQIGRIGVEPPVSGGRQLDFSDIPPEAPDDSSNK